MAKFRKKPVVIEAIQFTGNMAEMEMFVSNGRYGEDDTHFFIQTLEGEMRADLNDWIIKGVNSEFYPIKEEIFCKTYEPVE